MNLSRYLFTKTLELTVASFLGCIELTTRCILDKHKLIYVWVAERRFYVAFHAHSSPSLFVCEVDIDAKGEHLVSRINLILT